MRRQLATETLLSNRCAMRNVVGIHFSAELLVMFGKQNRGTNNAHYIQNSWNSNFARCVNDQLSLGG
jgi:hypothetical protein